MQTATDLPMIPCDEGSIRPRTPQLERQMIPGIPAGFYYIPSFVTEEHEDYILQEIAKLPESRWTNLTHRRLLSLPSPLTGPSKDTLLASPMPPFLSKIILDKLKGLEIFEDSPHGAPNHCLVNEYRPGEGIMPHEDGPAYFPVTATVSLASHTVLDIYLKTEHGERKPTSEWRILQEPRSLLVTAGNLYKDTLHGIPNIDQDENLNPEAIVNWPLLADKARFEAGSAKRQSRVSLTYRDVLKVAKVGGALKFLNRR